MDQSRDSQLFSSRFEVASFVTSSGLLQRSWDVITSTHAGITCNIGVGLSWKVYKEPNTNVTIIAFEATLPDSSNPQTDFVSLNSIAVSLFIKNHDKFDPEISNYENSRTPLIITGHGLGGAVASQLTISQLGSLGRIRSAKNHLLCITFGSPLVGNKKMQEAISCNSKWNSSFLHVVSHKDPLPRLFITNTTSSYTPFGTFLLYSHASSTCSDNPDSVWEIVKAFSAIHVRNQGFQTTEYGNIVENLNLKAICKDVSIPPEDMIRSLETGMSLQLQALGFTGSQTSGISMQQQNIDVNVLKPEIKKQQRRISFDPSKEINNVKGHMAQLEWYKKETKTQQIGYYDSYKKMNSQFDHDVVVFHKKLTQYWEKMVEEVELKPRKGRHPFLTRWIFGETNYSRLVEPLAIAEYYRDGGKDYISEGRSEHFKRLEEWLNERNTRFKSALNSTSRRNVEAILTIDSCFWAHVEEALLSCKQLNDVNSSVSEKEEAIRKLLEFENYVYGQLKNYAVSPEIFLNGSSYIRWWNQYKEIMGSAYRSALANFMSNADNYNVEYVRGTYDFIDNYNVEYVEGTYNFIENSETQTLYHFLLKHKILCCCPHFLERSGSLYINTYDAAATCLNIFHPNVAHFVEIYCNMELMHAFVTCKGLKTSINF